MKPGTGAGKVTRKLDPPMFRRRPQNAAIGKDRMEFFRVFDRYRQGDTEVVEVVIGWQKGLKITAVGVAKIRHIEDSMQTSRIG